MTNVTVLDNPARFQSPFQFEVSFECIAPIADDIEWRLIYVGSAETDQHDQLLDSVLVGPVQVEWKNDLRFVCAASTVPAPLTGGWLQNRI